MWRRLRKGFPILIFSCFQFIRLTLVGGSLFHHRFPPFFYGRGCATTNGNSQKSSPRGTPVSPRYIQMCWDIVKDDGKAELRHILELHVRGFTSLVTAENTSCGAKCLLFVLSLLPTDENAVKHVSLMCVCTTRGDYLRFYFVPTLHVSLR